MTKRNLGFVGRRIIESLNVTNYRFFAVATSCLSEICTYICLGVVQRYRLICTWSFFLYNTSFFVCGLMTSRWCCSIIWTALSKVTFLRCLHRSRRLMLPPSFFHAWLNGERLHQLVACVLFVSDDGANNNKSFKRSQGGEGQSCSRFAVVVVHRSGDAQRGFTFRRRLARRAKRQP